MSLNEIIVKADSIGDPVIESTTEKFKEDPKREKKIKNDQKRSLREDLKDVTSMTQVIIRVARRHPNWAIVLAIVAIGIAFGRSWLEIWKESKYDVNIHIFVNDHEVTTKNTELQSNKNEQYPNAESQESTPSPIRSR